MITGYVEFISRALNTLSQGNVAALGALFIVLALGEFGVPFPYVLQGVLFFIGYQISQGAGQVIPILLILVLGRQFGSGIVYWLARLVGSPFLGWYEKHFRLLRNKLDRLKEKLNTRVPLAIAAGRLTPGLLVPTSLLSGTMRVRYDHFALGILLSAAVWDWTFITFGIVSARGAQQLALTSYPWLVPVVGFAVVTCLAWALSRFILSPYPHSRSGAYPVNRVAGSTTICASESSAIKQQPDVAGGQMAYSAASLELAEARQEISVAESRAPIIMRDNILLRHLRRFGHNTTSFLLAYGGCNWFESDTPPGLVAYVRTGRTCVVIGDPLCSPENTVTLLQNFPRHVGKCHRIVLTLVSGRLMPQLKAAGYGAIEIGSDPFFDLHSWEPRGDRAKKVRSAVNLARRQGVTVTCYQPAEQRDLNLEKELQACTQAWLASQRGFDMRFFSGVRPLALAEEKRYFLAWHRDRLVGFLTCSPIYARNGWYVEDIVRRPDAVYGTTELLITSAFKSLREAGFSLATLGLSPFTDMGTDVLHPGRMRLIRAICLILSSFYNFRGVYHYRKKFAPSWWEKVYIAFWPDRLTLGLTLDVAKTIIPGGLPGLVCGWLASYIRSFVTQPIVTMWRRLHHSASEGLVKTKGV